LTAPIIEDPDWDWVPITTGSEVVVGDVVVWAASAQFVVDDITQAANGEGGTTYTFTNADDTAEADVDWPPLVRALRYTRTEYVVTAHPAVGSRFRSPDGARWVFQASKTYRCFVGSSVYPVGTVLTRVSITGGLVAE